MRGPATSVLNRRGVQAGSVPPHVHGPAAKSRGDDVFIVRGPMSGCLFLGGPAREQIFHEEFCGKARQIQLPGLRPVCWALPEKFTRQLCDRAFNSLRSHGFHTQVLSLDLLRR